MLTAELLQHRRRAGRVRPLRIDPGDGALLTLAADLIAALESHIGSARSEVDEALRAVQPAGIAPKTGQGLAHLLLERCTFDTPADVEPVALRAAACDASAAAWRAGAAPPTDDWRARVLAQAAASAGVSAEALERHLFADLADNQRLLAVDAPRPAWLLHRFNTAQVQGLLLRAERLELAGAWPGPQRLRQLLRYLKFFGLLYRLEEHPAAASRFALSVDGPLSVLEGGTRYGLNLAQFYPALLLWDAPWEATATVHPGKRGAPARLELAPHPWLRSHYPDHGQWVADDTARFVAAFNKGGKGWQAAPAEALLALPGNRYLVPDFTLTADTAATGGAGNASPVYLEHLAQPDATLAAQRLADIAAHRPGDYLLACRGVPSVRELAERHPQLVLYRRSLLPGGVREALERLRG